jgi:hypothetical protein
LQGERGKHRERPRDRRPDDDIGSVCRVAHGEIGEPMLLSMQGILNTTYRRSLNTCAAMLRTGAVLPTVGEGKTDLCQAGHLAQIALLDERHKLADAERGGSTK